MKVHIFLIVTTHPLIKKLSNKKKKSVLFVCARFTFFPLFFSDVSQKDVQEKEIIVGIVTDIDLLHHVSHRESHSGENSGGKGPVKPVNFGVVTL